VADDYNGSGQYGVADTAISWDTSSIPPSARVVSANFYIWSCIGIAQDSGEDLAADWVSGQPMAPSAMYPPEINQGSQALNPVSLSSLPWSSNYSSCIQGQAAGGENIWSVTNPGSGIIPGGTTMMRLKAARNGNWPSNPWPGQAANYAYFAGTGNAANYPPLLYVTYVVPPPAPTQLSTNGTIRTVTPQLTVSSVSDPDGDAPVNYAFLVNSAANGGGSTIYNPGWLANTTSVTVPGGTLNWNQAYSWVTCAYDGTSLDASVGAWSCSGWTNFTPVPYPPAVPTPVAPPANAWITSPYQFSAQPVSDPNGGSTSYDFQVWNSTQVVADSNWISSPNYTFSLPDGNYFWQVESRASEGPTVSGWTNRANYPFNVDTTPPPAPVITPAMVTWTSNPNASYSWTDSDSRVGGYAYTFATSTTASPGSSRGSGTSTTQSATSVGTWYFIIEAINNAGVAGPTATATYQYGTPPNAPTQVNAVASDGQAVINWLASTINGAPLTNYTVTATGVPTVSTTSTSATITGLTDGQLYSFNVGPTSPVGPGPSGPANPVSPAAPPTGGGIGPLEQLGGCRCGYSTQDNFGQNVDAATGDFWTTHQDLSIPGRGPAINFAETYNSLLAGTNGPLGYGWTFSYGMSLTISTSTVVVNQENGSQATFTQSGSLWSAPPRVLATLVQNASTWTFTRAKQIFDFDSSGHLIDEKDPNNYTTTLSYSGGLLSSITDPAQRKVNVGWDQTGTHITDVTDTASSPQRSLHFQYFDNAGDLTGILDVGGGLTSFGYNTSTHDLTSMGQPDRNSSSTNYQPPSPAGGSLSNIYDGAHRVTQQGDYAGNVLSFAYSGTPTSTMSVITDQSSQLNTAPQVVESYEYGELAVKTQGYGTSSAATWQYSYDPASAGITLTIDPRGNSWKATYDAAGNRTSTTDPLSHSAHTYYDAWRDVTQTVDANGVATTMIFDPAGNLQSQSTPLLNSSGQVVATQAEGFAYTDGNAGDVTSVTDPNTKTSTFGYDTNGDVVTATDGAGDSTQYCYDNVGHRTAVIAPLGTAAGVTCGSSHPTYKTTFTYNAFGDLLKETDPLGNTVVNQTYTADRNIATSTDANQNKTTYQYDADNEPTVTTPPAAPNAPAASTVNTYRDHNLIIATQQNGHQTSYAFLDPAWPNLKTSMTVSVAGCVGNEVTNYSYDANGNLLAEQDPAGTCAGGWQSSNLTTSHAYDTANRLTSTSYSDGTTPNVTIGYDNDGQRTSMIDGTGTSSFKYNSLHQLTSSSNGAGATVGYGYDLAGNVTSIAYPNPAGTVTRAYDNAERLRSVQDLSGGTTVYNYDADSNLLTQAYPNGTTMTLTSNAADQLATITDTASSAPSTPFMSFTYNRYASGQVSQTVSAGVPGAGTDSYQYDQLQQLVNVNNLANGYDAYQNSIKLVSGAVQGYDTADELTTSSNIVLIGTSSASDAGTSSSLPVTFPLTMTVNDQMLVSVSLPGSGTVTGPTDYTVVTTTATGTTSGDAKVVVFRHTVTSADLGTSAATFSFDTSTYPKAATMVVYRGVNATTPVDVVSAAVTTSATLLTLPSLSATLPGEQLVLLAGSNAGSAATWTAPTMKLQVSQPGGSSVSSVIADQGLVAKGATGAVQATSSARGSLGGVLVALSPAQASYLFDGRGDRISAISASGATTLGYDQAGRLTSFAKAGVTTTYAYDGTGLRASKHTGTNAEAFTWDEVTSNLLVDGSTDYVYGLGGLPLEQLSSAGALYYYQDQLGSTRALATPTGVVTATYTYDALGNLTGQTPVVNPPANPFGFAGQYADAESGLIYMRARYYDPATGQFLTRDPAFAQSGSFYGYAGNDPVNSIDPSGLFCLFGNVNGGESQCRGHSPRNDLVAAGGVLGLVGSVVGTVLSFGTLSEAAVPLGAASIGLLTEVSGALTEAAVASFVGAGVIDCSHGELGKCRGDFLNAGLTGALGLLGNAEDTPLFHGLPFTANVGGLVSSLASLASFPAARTQVAASTFPVPGATSSASNLTPSFSQGPACPLLNVWN
jgi:RHS repeat-associated protein